jgi:hypothetical protein
MFVSVFVLHEAWNGGRTSFDVLWMNIYIYILIAEFFWNCQCSNKLRSPHSPQIKYKNVIITMYFWFDEPQVQLRIKLQVLTRLSNHLIRWTILITQHCNTKNAANLVGRSLSNLPWRNPWWNRMGWTLTVRKQVSSTSSDPLAAATLAEAAFYIHAKTMSVSVFVFHEG